MEWIWAAVAIVAGIFIGTAASKTARQVFEGRRGRAKELAPAVGSLTFSVAVVIGLLVALGFVQPESLNKLRDDTIDYLPRVLSALIVVILGGVAGTLASTAAGETFGRTMGRTGEKIPTIIKGVITTFVAILAASQLGIDTTVINIVVAAVTGALALAFALVVGLGSHPIASEIASGRSLRRLVSPGDRIAGSDVTGTVVALHATAIEVEEQGATRLIPNSALTSGSFSVARASKDRPDDI